MKIKMILVAITAALMNISCDALFGNELEEAQNQFIQEMQYMTKRDALSQEIEYYKDPEITVGYKERDLTGKDVIHQCNIWIKNGRYADKAKKAKNYAVDHPDDVCGAVFYFEGVFTNYNNGYTTCKAKVWRMKTNDGNRWYVEKIIEK